MLKKLIITCTWLCFPNDFGNTNILLCYSAAPGKICVCSCIVQEIVTMLILNMAAQELTMQNMGNWRIEFFFQTQTMCFILLNRESVFTVLNKYSSKHII